MFTINQFYTQPLLLDSFRDKDEVPLECNYCKIMYFETKHNIRGKMWNKYTTNFCSRRCQSSAKTATESAIVKCDNCSEDFKKRNSQINRSKYHFCCRSCSATHNNKNKMYGTRRSKLECWLQEQLSNLYPTLTILYNHKHAVMSELDIFIPSLSLAFELNGIFHYEPIFGEEKLNKIQSNDKNKFQQCRENDISLCIIDTSAQKYTKPKTSKKYLDIITNIIDEDGGRLRGRTENILDLNQLRLPIPPRAHFK